tara:strand:- start:5606 stop:6406 length:801 start_codon:yes stop_codon:yes gene_type:complete
MDKPIEILKMRDVNENHYIDKGLLFNLPMKLLVVGKSQLSGKSNLVGALLLMKDERLYKDTWKPENIFVFSGSLQNDEKIKTICEEIGEEGIPNSNLFDTYDEEIMDTIYEMIKEKFMNDIKEGDKPEHSLVILDDLSFGGNLKKSVNGAISKMFCNGRHILLSTILTSQKLTDILSVCRENATGGIFFNCSEKQLDLMEQDNNYLQGGMDNPKKVFKNMFRDTTREPHSFFVVNYSNSFDKMYMNRNFIPIDIDIHKTINKNKII